MKFTIAFLMLLSIQSDASPYRYAIRGKCFVVNLNSKVYQAVNYGSMTGVSNQSCDEASENLDRICEEKGGANATAYRDILVVEKSYASSAQMAISEKRNRVLFGLIQSGHAFSVSAGRSSSESTQVLPVPIDSRPKSEGGHCSVNMSIPQQKQSMIQGYDIGG